MFDRVTIIDSMIQSILHETQINDENECGNIVNQHLSYIDDTEYLKYTNRK